MPQACRLCSDPRGEEIDKLLRDGASFRDFQVKYPDLAAVSESSVSRHRKYHIEVKPSEAEFQQYVTADAVQAKKKIIRELASLVKRAKAKGKIREQIDGLAKIAQMNDEIRELEQSGESDQGAPIITVVFRSVEEVEAARCEARAKIRTLEPENVVLQEQVIYGIEKDLRASEPEPQRPAQAENEGAKGGVDVWGKLGDLQN